MMSAFCRGYCLVVIICFGYGFLSYAADDSALSKSASGDSGAYLMAEYQQDIFVNTIGMKFKLLRPGTFVMGSIDGAEDEMPVHLVTITRPFYMGVYEVTQEQWKQVMGKNPSAFEDDKRPVENVSWNEVLKFIKKLSEKEGVHYRLPTEAEWEYSCRAGTKTRFYWGDEFSGEYAWYLENSGGTTQSVGQKKPNAWGLYDMTGNVYEWCADSYGDYTVGQLVDPEKSGSTRRIGRGGSWNTRAEGCRSSNRGSNHPFRRFDVLGFRLVRDQ
jgi:formylglycine-generating enzyme required for sulfatase activity